MFIAFCYTCDILSCVCVCVYARTFDARQTAMRFLKRYQNLHKCRNEFADIRPFHRCWCFFFTPFFFVFYFPYISSNFSFFLSCSFLILVIRSPTISYIFSFFFICTFVFLFLHPCVSQCVPTKCCKLIMQFIFSL